jgi:hypothetical protein
MLEKVELPPIHGFPSMQILWRPFSGPLRLEFCVIAQKVILPGFATFLSFATMLQKFGKSCDYSEKVSSSELFLGGWSKLCHSVCILLSLWN